jgi:hypothetical protein
VERARLNEAMERLLLGQPVRTDGKLTIVNLAKEASLPRHTLTKKHTDLRDEFRDRVRALGESQEPTVLANERAEVARLKKLNHDLAAENDVLKAQDEAVLQNLVIFQLQREMDHTAAKELALQHKREIERLNNN